MKRVVMSATDVFLPDIHMRTHLIGDNDGYLHSHNYVEVFYLLEGSVRHVVNGRASVLDIGSAVLLRPSDWHYFDRSDDAVCLHRDLMFTVSQFSAACSAVNPDFYPSLIAAPVPPVFRLTPAEIDFLENRIKKINRVPNEDVSTKRALITALNVELIGLAIENLHLLDTRYPSWFNDFLSLFNKADIIAEGLPALKAHTNLNYSYLCRQFKAYMGKTISEYLNETRLNYAASLLRGTDLSILNVSQNVGFESLSYFNAQFKKRYGITPHSYRKT